MPKKKKGEVTITQAFKALRKMGKNKEADALIVVRGRLDQKGEWTIDWDAAHWLPDLPDECIASSGLPAGFGMAAAQEVASVSANDVAEDRLGRFGAALGKGIWDTISERLNQAPPDEGNEK